MAEVSDFLVRCSFFRIIIILCFSEIVSTNMVGIAINAHN